MDNKKTIVITSIFHPTEAVIAFSKFPGYQLIVVGDQKTPPNWSCNNVQFLAFSDHKSLELSLEDLLPHNHYCRKMLGYLKAIENGAEFIIDTDDDNIPKGNWEFPGFEDRFECVEGDKGFVNIYQLFTSNKIWPRGLPLSLISTDFSLSDFLSFANVKIGVWQGLADEDPDVDAIYRLTNNNKSCYFDRRSPVVLKKGTISPFNSQNTLIRKELFPLLYLPTSVTFRFTDILRGLVAQPIMWLYDYHLGFIDATVVQLRNPHDYMKDFIMEVPMYEHCTKIVDIVSAAISKGNSIESNLVNAYKSLIKENVVNDSEMLSVEAWLEDFKKLNK